MFIKQYKIKYLGSTQTIHLLESFEQYLIRQGAGLYCCSICNQTRPDKTDLLIHVESKHFPHTFTYSCPFCEKTFGTYGTFKTHKSTKHRNQQRDPLVSLLPSITRNK